LNQGERKRLESLRKATGLSFANIFRLKVLGEVTPMPDSEEFKAAIAEQMEIFERTDIPEAKKRKLSREVQVRRIAEKRVAAEGGRHKRKSA